MIIQHVSYADSKHHHASSVVGLSMWDILLRVLFFISVCS